MDLFNNLSHSQRGAPISRSAERMNTVSPAHPGRGGSGVRRVQQGPITLNKDNGAGNMRKAHSMDRILTLADGHTGRSLSLDTVSPTQPRIGGSGIRKTQYNYPGAEHSHVTEHLESGICTMTQPFIFEISSLSVPRKPIVTKKITFYREMTLKVKGLLASIFTKPHSVGEETNPRTNRLIPVTRIKRTRPNGLRLI